MNSVEFEIIKTTYGEARSILPDCIRGFLDIVKSFGQDLAQTQNNQLIERYKPIIEELENKLNEFQLRNSAEPPIPNDFRTWSTENFSTVREKFIKLFEDYENLCKKIRVVEDEIAGKIAELKWTSSKTPSVIVRSHRVNLNEHPVNCAPFGTYAGLTTKLGDAHACIPKILYFMLKTGVARINPRPGETAEAIYERIVYICSELTLEKIPHPSHMTRTSEKRYEKYILELNGRFSQIEFHQECGVVLFGDILTDSHGNDIVTALFFKWIHDSGLGCYILFSNHDAAFTEWIEKESFNEPIRINRAQSTLAALRLFSIGILCPSDLHRMLNLYYFNKMSAFYYELDHHEKVHNKSTHAPLGDWERYRMIQGLTEYSQHPESRDLFTPSQCERLKELSKVTFNENDKTKKMGLSNEDSRRMMDLMNEIFYTHVCKDNKRDLNRLWNLGTNQMAGEQVDPYITPYKYLIWNRKCPRVVDPQDKTEIFLNGHEAMIDWEHHNASLDDTAGKFPNAMVHALMRWALPVRGYSPMPKIQIIQTTHPQPVTRSRSQEMSSSSRERDRSPVRSPYRPSEAPPEAVNDSLSNTNLRNDRNKQ